MKLDPLKTWFQTPSVWAIAVFVASGTLLYSRMDSAIGAIAATVERDAKERSDERDEIVLSVREVRDELRRLTTENVAQRQAQAWLELVRALNKAKFPELIWPDLPK